MLGFLVAGCGADKETEEPDDATPGGGTLLLAWQSQPPTLDTPSPLQMLPGILHVRFLKTS